MHSPVIPDSLCVHTWSLTLTTVRGCCEGGGGEGREGEGVISVNV